MPLQRVVDAVGRRIGLVDADGEALQRLERRDQRRGEALVVVMDDADLPRAGDALVDRREGMDRDQPGLAARPPALVDKRVDGVVEGLPGQRDALGALLVASRPRLPGMSVVSLICRDEVGRVERPVAVDGEPRNAGFDQRRVERVRHRSARPAARLGPRRCGAACRRHRGRACRIAAGTKLDAWSQTSTKGDCGPRRS